MPHRDRSVPILNGGNRLHETAAPHVQGSNRIYPTPLIKPCTQSEAQQPPFGALNHQVTPAPQATSFDSPPTDVRSAPADPLEF